MNRECYSISVAYEDAKRAIISVYCSASIFQLTMIYVGEIGVYSLIAPL